MLRPNDIRTNLLISAISFLGSILIVIVAGISTLPGPLTTFADGYSESGFASIVRGMKANDVEAIIGMPLRAVPRNSDDDLEVWDYTVQTDSRVDYLVRRILFDYQMRVKDKVSLYYSE
jgi:hypothetical protein